MQEISDFGVYPTHTPLINSGPVPDVERVRSAGFVQPTQLSLAVTWSELDFQAHSLGVSQVLFMPEAYWLLSGGNDGKVLLWDVSSNVGKQQKSPAKSLHRRKAQAAASSRKDGKLNKVASNEHPGVVPKLTIEHGEKVNWLSCAEIKGSRRVLVADQTSSVSVYPLPEP